MRQRLKSLKRVLSVQKDMHRLAEWQFAKLERQLHMLHAEHRRLLSHLDDERFFGTAFADRVWSDCGLWTRRRPGSRANATSSAKFCPGRCATYRPGDARHGGGRRALPARR